MWTTLNFRDRGKKSSRYLQEDPRYRILTRSVDWFRPRVRKSRYGGETLQSPIHCWDVTKPPCLFSGELCTLPLHSKRLFVYTMGAQITIMRGNASSSPIHCCDVTEPPSLISGELCTSPLHCLRTLCVVGAPSSASLCSEHINQT